MKKWLVYIGCFFFALFLVTGCSCTNKEDEDISISLGIGDMNASAFVELETTQELINKIENDDSFVLLVYGSWCDHCKNFKPILNSVIEERNLIVYGIQVELINGVSSLSSVQYIPTLVVYDKGEASAIIDPGVEETYFSNTKGLNNFFDKYTHKPIAYYITLEQLREKKQNEENFVVYFSNSESDASKYLNDNYMLDLFDTYHADKEFYILDHGGISDMEWQTIRDEFGLSEAGSSTFGYGEGVEPTFQFYKQGVLTDMAVFANDQVIETINDDGSVSVTITGSYYNDCIHIGETMLASDYFTTVDDFYNSKINNFLSQYLQFVD